MLADQVQVLVKQAAAGNSDALVALIQTYGHGLRLALAAHLDQTGRITPVEIAVWSAARQCLGEWMSDTPFATWLQQVAVEVVSNHLKHADRRAIDIQDVLTHQIIEHCRGALADGGELGVSGLGALVQALPETSKQLLGRRYRERQRTAAIATALMISEVEVATTLMAVRALCDWRQIARPPAPGDRLLPPLIEDWLSGTIDVDSRSLLATNLGRDFDRAAQFARQVRVHLALSALLTPFGREDAVALARRSGLSSMDSSRVIIGESVRSVSGSRSLSSGARRTTRVTTSTRQVGPMLEETGGSSPLPWILGGGMVLIGVIALMATTPRGQTAPVREANQLASSPASTVSASSPTAIPTNQPAPTPPTNPPPVHVSAPSGGVLRVDPGRSDRSQQRSTTAPAISISGPVTKGTVDKNDPLEVSVSLSHIVGVKMVEYYLNDQRVGSADVPPYSWIWEEPAVGAYSLSARAIAAEDVLATSPPITVEVLQPLGGGGLRRDWWIGVGGRRVADGVNTAGYPDLPHGSEVIARFLKKDWGDHYLQRLHGYIHPPMDGDYTFSIAADDEAQLLLSENDTRAQLRQIALAPASESSWVRYEDWDRDPRQHSAKINLRRGQRYYVEVLHKELEGGDHVIVGWQLPSGQLQRPIAGRHLTPANEPTRLLNTAFISVPGSSGSPPTATTAISNLLVRSIDFVSSGEAYRITEAHNDDFVYIDRHWRFKDLPQEFNGATLVRTRNDDDVIAANPHLRFTVDQPVVVYVAMSNSITTLPAWLQSWTPTEIMLELRSASDYRLYRANFPAGSVSLGGNEREKSGAKDNYFVLVLPSR